MNLSPDLLAHWPAISRLLDEALALREDERDAWLEALGGVHAEHRATLRTLLSGQAQVETDDFLGALPPLPAGAVETIEAASAWSDATASSLVGPYRLISEIGRGGMGTVWLAERADGMLKRQVALKLPRAVWGDAFTERLAREREILAGLDHPHIARLYDAGVDAHGRPFLAMAYVAGKSIDLHCRDQALTLQARVELLLQVMSAVAHAHARLVVHRDLKPNNILVGDDDQVVLLDFGIAKLLDGEHTRETALTAVSGRALTLDYASPEQIRGEPLGTASDIYSLAVVAYALLAGGLPYRLKRGSAAELEEAIAAVEAPHASDTATDAQQKRQLRGDLDAILNKALKKQVAERYPTMDAFADDLRRWRDGEPVQARPDTARYRAAKFVSRHRLQVAAGGVVALALALGLSVAIWQAREARIAAVQARTEAATAKAVRGFIESVFSSNSADQDDPKRSRETTARELLDRGAERIERELAGVPDAQFELYGLMFSMYLNMGLNERATVLARRRLALALRVFKPDDPRSIDASVMLAKVLVDMNQRDEARVLLEEASVRSERLPPGDNDDLRMTISGNLANLYFNTDPPRALALARVSAALARGKPPSQKTINAQQMLGDMANVTGHLEEAEAAFNEAQAQIERQADAGRGGLPLILASLGEVQDKLGRVETAGQTLIRALALADHNGDPYALRVVSYRLSGYRIRNGLLHEALPTAAADDAWGHTAGPDFGPLPVSVAGQHARVLVAMGDPARALAVVDSVHAKLDALPPRLRSPVLAARIEALVLLGRTAEAEADIRLATELVTGNVAAAGDVVEMVRQARRRYWLATGRADQALVDLREGSAAALGPKPTPLAVARRQAEEARLLWAAGRRDEAEALSTSALSLIQTLPQRRYAWQAEAEAAEVLGRALLAVGQAATAAPHLARAVSLREAEEDPQKSPMLAAALLARAECLAALGDAAAGSADKARAHRMADRVSST